MAWIDALFKRMKELRASDLHMTSGMKPMYRIDGDMVPIKECPAIEPEQMRQILFEIAPEENRSEFEQDNDTDFAYEIEGCARFRANLFMDRKGPGAVFRLIPNEILTAEDLKLSKHVLDLCFLSKGLVLVTGPTGSGKSTTLAALVDYINRNRNDHIITIEDPIEFVHEDKKCLLNQRQVGRHTGSFKRALRASLREDPDIILVGELRDLETIEIAIETAETGHLVFGTLHTSTAATTVDRIIDQFPADRQAQIRTMLSSSLKAVLAQTLCKKIGGGRAAALEVLISTNAVAAMVREGKTHQLPSVMQTGSRVGMRLLNDSLTELVENGVVTPEEAYVKAIDKESLLNTLRARGMQLDLSKVAEPAAEVEAPAPGGGHGVPGVLGTHSDPRSPLPAQDLPDPAQSAQESVPAPPPGAGAGAGAGAGGGAYTDPFDAFKKKRR